MKLAALGIGVGLFGALCCAPRSAAAFEREWHLGGGLGVSNGSDLKLSPALAAYAAYGLSDAFDARVEVTARGYHLGTEQKPNAISAMAGIAYKLDVLRWVPWAGVYVGYLQFAEKARPLQPCTDPKSKDAEGKPADQLCHDTFNERQAAIGLGLGLDYAFSRSFGVGVTLRFDDALVSQTAATFDALLRAEYRWGW